MEELTYIRSSATVPESLRKVCVVGWWWWWFRPVLGFSLSQAEQYQIFEKEYQNQHIQREDHGHCKVY